MHSERMPAVGDSLRFPIAFILLCCLAPASHESRARAQSPALDYNRDIRPILSENCFYCHGQDANKRKADLRLDVRDVAIEVGAIVPKDPAQSALVSRVNSNDPDEQMPPPKSNRRLSPEQKKRLEQWIAEGATYAPHWAFVAPERPVVPAVRFPNWVRNPIDRFVLAKLEAEGMSPSPEADRPTLIKRLSIDLIGLPPTPEDVDAFVSDRDPNAYENLVDRLLASPQYGERMALPWLDAARYADSNGFQQDGDTWQWVWRDWLVKALNADMPFDQFTTRLLAGDLLPQVTIDDKIASGFNRNHLLNGEGGAIPEEQRFVNLFDRIDTTATTWLGLTMACAQCHDHKYDPITQRDYYSLLDGFNRVPESGAPQFFSSRIRVAAPFVEASTEETKTRIAELEAKLKATEAESKLATDAAFEGWRLGIFADGKPADGKSLPDALVPILRKGESERDGEEKKTLEAGLRKHFEEKVRPTLATKLPAISKFDEAKKQLNDFRGDQLPRVMVMSDAKPRETAILTRGEYLKPGEKVTFAAPSFLPPLPKGAPANRLGFAQWLFMPDQPLTARVQVNRMWQEAFGAGIVKTAEDFGVQSEYPIHGQLLDWLAVEFGARGWSMKAMHRLILTSATCRQSSRVTSEHRTRDLENRLYSRAGRFRMPSLILRDWALASSGLIDTRIGGRPVYPYQPGAIWEALAITKERDFTYPASSGLDLYRRSLYTFWRRTVGPANMFDVSNRQTCRVRSAKTSTPLHALTTLNDPTWVEAARALAEKGMKASRNIDGRLSRVFRLVMCRKPTDFDLMVLRRAYAKQAEIFAKDDAGAKAFLAVGESKRDDRLNVREHAALSAVCLAILNLDEALTRE
jgi:Protein of unknown function (DUF1549)/Protein of unknown function (DUF1553)/Planctomycete cytochrome C